MEDLKTALSKLISDPYSPTTNFKLAREYEKTGHYAAAVGYYLRTAEFTNDMLSYEALIRCSLCFAKLEKQEISEITMLEHAISAFPHRPEAHYILSLYHSWRGNWLKAYTSARVGLNCTEFDSNFRIDTCYKGRHSLLFEKARCGYKKGKLRESKEIYHDLLSDSNLSSGLRASVNSNLDAYPEPMSTPIIYENKKHDKLGFKFNGSGEIQQNYSQIYQDMFVLTMLNGKREGYYFEIGAGDPIYGNNTYMLETEFGWNGISVDINENSCKKFNKMRQNTCLCRNALEIDYNELLKDYDIIDYLQLDCDPPDITFKILKLLPLDRVKFRTITYEHDYYNDRTRSYRRMAREFLQSHGYKMVAGNIAPNEYNEPYEDWWIHPDLVDENIYRLFERNEDTTICGEKQMFLSKKKYSSGKLIQSPAIDNYIYTVRNYHNDENAIFKLYKKCNACDCIRRGYLWEEHLHNVINYHLDNTSTAIDVGSHIGLISVKLAKVCNMVHCFEPLNSSFDLLKINMGNNCDERNYTLYNKGLGDSLRKERIAWISHEGPGGVGVTKNGKGSEYGWENTPEMKESQPVDVITIDSIKLAQLDFIKIDVEGYEENVIKGGIETIKRYKPIIVIECYETFRPLNPATVDFVETKYKFLIDIGYIIKHLWNADFILFPPKITNIDKNIYCKNIGYKGVTKDIGIFR